MKAGQQFSEAIAAQHEANVRLLQSSVLRSILSGGDEKNAGGAVGKLGCKFAGVVRSELHKTLQAAVALITL